MFQQPTYSSPIALSADNRLLWSVNPGDNSVSVLRTDNDTVLKKIYVGREPQSVALDPNNKFAFVANAAGSSVTVIKIINEKHGGFAAKVEKTIKTGAEPWNIVSSPDGKRVFVANSGQDTITVINALSYDIIGQVNLRKSLCNDPDRTRHFQPRGLAVSLDNKQLFVTRFLSFTKPGGAGADDEGEEGLVCRLDINTNANGIGGYQPAGVTRLAAQLTGFDITGVAGTASTAFPNQLQSIVLRGSKAYLPNIAASPESPLQFQNSTQAYLNVIDGVGGQNQISLGALNLHLGAKVPEAGKKKLFFANPWGIAFTTQGGPGNAYVISAGSDLLVKLNVDAEGNLSFTGGASFPNTTRYIDLNDPLDAATNGDNAGKNPQGIVITTDGAFAYVANFVSRNISKVNLTTDKVVKVIRTTPLPDPGSPEEKVLVGAEMFFSGRGHFDRPLLTTISTDERLSQDGWQNCASCHFKGLTDGVVWVFAPGPRKSIPMGGTFNPNNRNEQRILNYSSQRDETQDFTLNVRNVSGPGNVAVAEPCSVAASRCEPVRQKPRPDRRRPRVRQATVRHQRFPQAEHRAQPSHRDPAGQQHGGASAGRPERVDQVRGPRSQRPADRRGDQGRRVASGDRPGPSVVQGSAVHELPPWRAVDRHREGFHAASRRHGHLLRNGQRRGSLSPFQLRNCCGSAIGNPNNGQFLNRFLKDVGSFNLGVKDGGNELGNNIGGVEKSAAVVTAGVLQPQQDALGMDYNARQGGGRLRRVVAPGDLRRPALRPQRRLRDPGLRGRRREAPHRQRHAARRAENSREAGQGGQVPRVDRRPDQAVPLRTAAATR